MREMKNYFFLFLFFILLRGQVLADKSECSFSGSTAINFGTYDVLSSQNTTFSGNVNYSCSLSGEKSKGKSLNVLITLSKGSSSTYNPRTMMSGLIALNYNVYLDSALTQIWGDGTSLTFTYANVVTTTGNFAVPVFGLIPAKQDITAGNYTDTLIATMNF